MRVLVLVVGCSGRQQCDRHHGVGECDRGYFYHQYLRNDLPAQGLGRRTPAGRQLRETESHGRIGSPEKPGGPAFYVQLPEHAVAFHRRRPEKSAAVLRKLSGYVPLHSEKQRRGIGAAGRGTTVFGKLYSPAANAFREGAVVRMERTIRIRGVVHPADFAANFGRKCGQTQRTQRKIAFAGARFARKRLHPGGKCEIGEAGFCAEFLSGRVEKFGRAVSVDYGEAH